MQAGTQFKDFLSSMFTMPSFSGDEDDEDKDSEERQLGGVKDSAANLADYYDDYKENMPTHSVKSNNRSHGRPTKTSSAARTRVDCSNSTRARDTAPSYHHPQPASRPHPQPAETQTASTSRTSDLPPQPTARDNRRADKVAAAEEAQSQPKDPRPSNSTIQRSKPDARSSTKGKHKPRKERGEERVCHQSGNNDANMDNNEVCSAH